MAESSTQELGRTAAPPHIGIGIAVMVVALAVLMLVGSPVAALGVGCVIGLALDRSPFAAADRIGKLR